MVPGLYSIYIYVCVCVSLCIAILQFARLYIHVYMARRIVFINYIILSL